MSKCVLIIFMTLLIAALAEAKPVLTVTCNSPKGTRFDYGTGQFGTGMKVETNKDGYRGVTPVFVIDDAKPNKMLVIWGESKTLGPAAETKAAEAIICTKQRIKYLPLSLTRLVPGYIPYTRNWELDISQGIVINILEQSA
ncbi:MAG: hypothetical protein O7B35_09325 [Deltaproteobacteria bacterium]|nr:hypothetical protein [Deltaproteobacteria bacterium]